MSGYEPGTHHREHDGYTVTLVADDEGSVGSVSVEIDRSVEERGCWGCKHQRVCSIWAGFQASVLMNGLLNTRAEHFMAFPLLLADACPDYALRERP